MGEPITVTVLLKPPAGLAEQLVSGRFDPQQANTAVRPEAVSAVQQFADKNNLSVVSQDLASRRVVLSGRREQFQNALGPGLSVPPSLEPYVTAFLGLDDRPVAHRSHQGNA